MNLLLKNSKQSQQIFLNYENIFAIRLFYSMAFRI